MNNLTPIYVLDTSAWLTLIEDEAGADTVQDILEKAKSGEATVLADWLTNLTFGSHSLEGRR